MENCRPRNLLQDCKHTLIQLARHLIFAALLTLRLYALPLIHILRLLSGSARSWTPASYQFITPATPITASCTTTQVVPRGRAMLNAVMSSFATIQTIWKLGCFARSNPQLLQNKTYQQCSSQANFSRRINTLSVSSIDSSEWSTPTRASEIYHHALANGTKLNNLLQALKSVKNQQDNPPVETPRERDPEKLSILESALETPSGRTLSKSESIQLNLQDISAKPLIGMTDVNLNQPEQTSSPTGGITERQDNSIALCEPAGGELVYHSYGEMSTGTGNNTPAANDDEKISSATTKSRCSVYEQKHRATTFPVSKHRVSRVKNSPDSSSQERGPKGLQRKHQELQRPTKPQGKARWC